LFYDSVCLDWSTRVVDPDPSFGKFHKLPITTNRHW